MVGINVPIPVPVAYYTFGGWKRSGFGDLNQHGPDSIRFYTKTKTVTSRWPSGVKEGAEFSIRENVSDELANDPKPDGDVGLPLPKRCGCRNSAVVEERNRMQFALNEDQIAVRDMARNLPRRSRAARAPLG